MHPASKTTHTRSSFLPQFSDFRNFSLRPLRPVVSKSAEPANT